MQAPHGKSTDGDATRFPVSDHCDGTRFFNTDTRLRQNPSGILRWLLTRPASTWPKHINDPAHPPPVRVGADRIAVTFIGHASFLIQVGGVTVLTDPVWSRRCSPLPFAGPERVRDPGQRLEDLPTVDVLAVSHNHYDHMDMPTLKRVRSLWNPATVTGLGNARYLSHAGLAATELDWWQSVEMGGLRITYTPAQHFSARWGFDCNRALWGGFMLEAGGATVYFAGDSGWCGHFAAIGRRFPRIDLALIPIGAYQPRELMVLAHMNPEEAVEAHRALGAKRSLGMHFGTFRDLTDEPIDEPVTRLRAARSAAGLPDTAFDVPAFGQTLEFPVSP